MILHKFKLLLLCSKIVILFLKFNINGSSLKCLSKCVVSSVLSLCSVSSLI